MYCMILILSWNICRLAEKKAAIGYTYEDSTPAKEGNGTNDEDVDDDDILSDDEVDLGEETVLSNQGF